MSKGKNRKPKAGQWSKYGQFTLGRLDVQPCGHDWQNGTLAEGWQKCRICDAVRRYVSET